MKNTTSYSPKLTSGKSDSINFLPDSDIQQIKEKFCSPSLFADSPTELFKGMKFVYKSDIHTDIRKMMRNSSILNEGYFDETTKKFNYPEVIKNFDTVNKLEIIDSKGNKTGIYLITLKLKSRLYIHFYFNYNAVKSELNSRKGETLKS